MRFLKRLMITLLVLIFSCKSKEELKHPTTLKSIIEEYQAHEGYDKKQYPLGLYTVEYYKTEAEFAQNILDVLSKIGVSNLSETDQISAELLAFVLQDQIDF